MDFSNMGELTYWLLQNGLNGLFSMTQMSDWAAEGIRKMFTEVKSNGIFHKLVCDRKFLLGRCHPQVIKKK